PQKIDGKDIFPVMQCLPDVKSPHQYIYYAGNVSRITGVRNYRFKLNSRGNPGLYDLQSDLGETKDVTAEYPEVVKELEGAIEAFQKDLDKHSLEAPFDAGQSAYKKIKEEKPSKKEKPK
ncbi:MAG: hypothetical protein V1244_07190, partial [Nitrospinaceae bacterium]|nr:hypothetical protein [Nitrospinaceae bacterium]